MARMRSISVFATCTARSRARCMETEDIEWTKKRARPAMMIEIRLMATTASSSRKPPSRSSSGTRGRLMTGVAAAARLVGLVIGLQQRLKLGHPLGGLRRAEDDQLGRQLGLPVDRGVVACGELRRGDQGGSGA